VVKRTFSEKLREEDSFECRLAGLLAERLEEPLAFVVYSKGRFACFAYFAAFVACPRLALAQVALFVHPFAAVAAFDSARRMTFKE
jgi:hypothetical protein